MSKTKIVLSSIGGFIGLIAVLFILGLVGLGFFKFFEPKRENIRREVFENTKSYTHGVIQDLGKYYQEYNDAKTTEDKATIKSVVSMRFAEFDETKIENYKLQQFLIQMRGY